MFEPNKPRYLTRGVDESILPELRVFMWAMIDNMPEPKDYLQVFNLYIVDGVQIVKHSSEQPEYEMLYVFPEIEEPVTVKVYVIDSDDYCTMLLAEEY